MNGSNYLLCARKIVITLLVDISKEVQDVKELACHMSRGTAACAQEVVVKELASHMSRCTTLCTCACLCA